MCVYQHVKSKAIGNNFLAKKGGCLLGDRSKKGGSLGVKLHKIWAIKKEFKNLLKSHTKDFMQTSY